METLGKARFGQVFISDTHRERIPELLKASDVPFSSWWVDGQGMTSMDVAPQMETS